MASGHTRTQPSLPWQGGPQVAQQASYEAAVRASGSAPAMLAVLRRYLRERGAAGATDAEVEIALGWPPNVVTARRNDLVDAGEVVVRWPGSRRPSVKTKPGKKPLNVVVWVLSACVTQGND